MQFPVDPGADATIGGMTGTGASGTTAVRYGTMRENVLSLTVVTAGGQVVRTRSRARKSSAGYDLTHLFVGSEGTLGIITEITLRIYPTPEAVSAAVCPFPSLEAAVNCVIQTVQLGVPVTRIELLDEPQVDAVNRRFGLGLSPDTDAAPRVRGERGRRCRAGADGRRYRPRARRRRLPLGDRGSERRRLWEARHGSLEANLALRPGSKPYTTDVCVPISRLAECITETRRDIDETGLIGPIIGHAGDGNFHVCFLIDPDDPAELAGCRGGSRADRAPCDRARRYVHRESTASATARRDFLPLEHGAEGVELMRTMKHALDPEGIMNPGQGRRRAVARWGPGLHPAPTR